MHGESATHHVIPVRVLATVFGVLIVLTVITVITARINLGGFNVPLALAIAASKAALVVSVFMALRYDNRVNALVFFIGSIFVVVFLVLTLSDTALRGALGITDAGVMANGPTGTPDPVAEAAESNVEPVQTPDGEAIYAQYLCNTCHSTDGAAGVGPTMQGIGTLQSRADILSSIVEPDAVIVEGYQPGVMTATLATLGFFEGITEAELDALVSYVASL